METGPRAIRVDVSADAVEQLPGADYADAFSVASIPGTTAAAWAKRSLGAGPTTGRRAFQQLVWHGLLGFDLAAEDAPDAIARWKMLVNEANLLVLAIDGRLMTGRIIFVIDDQSTTWTTALRYHHAMGPRAWAGLQYVHRAAAIRLLSRAAASFIDAYAADQGVESRSAVVQRALRLLRATDLGDAYEEAWDEWTSSGEASLWESTAADGIDDAAG
jgi:hypothetical protein